MDSNVVSKIKKLLALGERAGTEDEAKVAMQKAHELLAKHNLAMGDVTFDEVLEETVETDESTPTELRNTLYKDEIYAGVAELYFCHLFYRKRIINGQTKRWLCITGKPSNIAITKYLAAYICRTGENLAKEVAKTEAQNLANDGVILNIRAYKNSFKIGFATRIRQRATVQIRAARNNEMRDDTGTALILAPVYARENKLVQAHLGTLKLNLKTSSRAVYVKSESGYQAGQNAANSVNFDNSAVSSKAQRLLG